MRRFVLFVLLLPLLMNLLLQSYGWMIILAPNGLLNRLALGLGLLERPVLLLFNETGVLLGLVHGSFRWQCCRSRAPSTHSARSRGGGLGLGGQPFAGNLARRASAESSRSCRGIPVVFAFNASAFVVPFVLGGRRVSMLAVLIRDQMGPLLNWPLGCATAVVLVVITLMTLAIYQGLMSRFGPRAR